MSLMSEQLEALRRKFGDVVCADKDARDAVIEELEYTIVILGKIRDRMAKKEDDEPYAAATAEEEEEDTAPRGQIAHNKKKKEKEVETEEALINLKLEALFRPYHTTAEQFIADQLSLPRGCMEAGDYLKAIDALETKIAQTEESVGATQAALKGKHEAFEEQRKLMENKAKIMGQPINQCELNRYTSAITSAESELRSMEQGLTHYRKRLWTLVHETQPIDAKAFQARFDELLKAKTQCVLRKRKAEAALLLPVGTTSVSAAASAASAASAPFPSSGLSAQPSAFGFGSGVPAAAAAAAEPWFGLVAQTASSSSSSSAHMGAQPFGLGAVQPSAAASAVATRGYGACLGP